MTKLCDPIWPNAGVQAWYTGKLQAIVADMAQDMLDRIRAAYAGAAPIAVDQMPSTREAAGVIFRDRLDRVLLLERSDGLGWAWPGGGVEPGETWVEAATRECREEIGHEPEGLSNRNIVNGQGGPVRYITFLYDIADAFIPVLNDEHRSFRWVHIEQAKHMDGLYSALRSTLLTVFDTPTSAMGWFGTDAKKMMPKAGANLLLRKALSRWSVLWTRRLEKVSDTIARDFAVRNKSATDTAMLGKLAKAGFTVKFKPTPASKDALNAVISENVGLIRTIPQKFLGDVEVAVWQSVMAGSDMDTLSREIKAKYGVAWRRAALIASDQNAKAKAAMERARREEVGITTAKWLHSHAGVVPRPTHVAMDGETYAVSEGMWDPAVQKRIWPGTEINCRCSDRALIPGFD